MHGTWIEIDGAPLLALAQDPPGEAQPEDRSEAFRPVEGGGSVAPGEVLLVEAYAAFWVIAMALILFTWRRQKQIDGRIAQLRADLDKARREE